MTEQRCRLLSAETGELAAWAARVEDHADSAFLAARTIARRLGAHVVDDHAEIGFWAPEIAENRVPGEDVFLEVFHPDTPLDLTADQQTAPFRRERLPVTMQGEYAWVAVAGMRAGTREQIGSFYQLTYRDNAGSWQRVPDVVAYSVPFGAFAPAEFYDIGRLDRERADRDYFASVELVDDEDGIPKFGPPANILQVHAGTASQAGTLAGLTRMYERIARKLEAGQALTPEEECYAGYEAIQLMPIEPTIEYEGGAGFWVPVEEEGESITIDLRRPDMTNWGYDVVISASSAINPVILESGRPDELVDLAAALHNFPAGPIQLIFDIVYGHADNQALDLLNHRFFAGPNMYGQDLRFRHPVVRAVMLEMQRRKTNFGADGLRVDGAQDFKYWHADAGEVRYDDDYLQEMSDVVQEVAGRRYRPWMIFEDGRPWPRADWELASTYRDVIELQPDVFQWSPLIFAHNTTFLQTFWINKWWRAEEVAQMGGNWIGGYANHDTLRRSTQTDTDERINRRLGETLPEILRNASDHPAATLLSYAMLPGVPMDFINATTRAPWSFIRNTDDRYGVKVVAEEASFLDWQFTPDTYAADGVFARVKSFGFTRLNHLRRFMRVLDQTVMLTDYDLEQMVALMQAVEPALVSDDATLSVSMLKDFSRAWMDDVHDYCNVARHTDKLDQARTGFNLAARQFRINRPWLMDNLREDEYFDRRRPAEGTVLFFGLRRSPDRREEVLFVANMEGAPATVTPTQLPIPNLAHAGWSVALCAPGCSFQSADAPIMLEDSDGIVLVRDT